MEKIGYKDKAKIRNNLQKKYKDIQTNWENLPNNWFEYEGFVYCITNLKTQQKYIGRKYFWVRRKNKISAESDWRTYKSSSYNLLVDIDNLGIEFFKFEILSVQRTIGETNQVEVEEQFKRNVLKSVLEDGTPEYYNDNIMSRYFRPKDFGTPEHDVKCSNISKALKDAYSSGKIIHPLLGKEHPSKGKKLPQTGKNKGKVMITNGTESTYTYVNSEKDLPEGWYFGSLKNKSLTCIHCGTEFIGSSNKKYCSDKCVKEIRDKVKESQKIIVKCICPVCKNTFVKNGTRKFCSDKCYNLNKETKRKKLYLIRKGEKK